MYQTKRFYIPASIDAMPATKNDAMTAGPAGNRATWPAIMYVPDPSVQAIPVN